MFCSDEHIVNLYFDRNETAITETKNKYEKYLFKIAYNILANIEDSNEGVNDTYFAAWNAMPPHRPTVLGTFLGKITRRISIDIFRKRRSLKRQAGEYAISIDELSECIPSGSIPEEEYEVKQLTRTINAFLRELSEVERNLFICRYFYLDSLKDSSKYCSVKEGTAKSILSRTRQKLKKYLENEGYTI